MVIIGIAVEGACEIGLLAIRKTTGHYIARCQKEG